VAGLGFKNELIAGEDFTASGFVLQLSVPVPLWDRRRAAASAFEAERRVHLAEADRLGRDIVRDVATAWAAMRALREQIEVIRPQLGEASRAALRAAEAAYAEGEISLVEWLDAVRAYQEAESSFATLQAEYVIQRAALERAVGARLN
jgi:cobalt-zinc-cadmium efflux system outer membrane protein